MKCSECVRKFIERVTLENGSSYTLNEEKNASVQKLCYDMDAFIDDIGGEFAFVNVDKDTMRVSVYISCDEIVFKTSDSERFLALISNVDAFGFRKADEDSIYAYFNFDGLWNVN